MSVVLVTGGAGGLGAAVCRQMAERGWTVAVADLDGAGAQAVADACGEPAFPIAVDLASAEGPADMVAEAVRSAGRLDVLVNLAAVAPAEAFLDMSAAAWEQALLVNVRAIALATAAAGRVMAEQGGGSSTLPRRPRAWRSPTTPPTPRPRRRSIRSPVRLRPRWPHTASWSTASPPA